MNRQQGIELEAHLAEDPDAVVRFKGQLAALELCAMREELAFREYEKIQTSRMPESEHKTRQRIDAKQAWKEAREKTDIKRQEITQSVFPDLPLRGY